MLKKLIVLDATKSEGSWGGYFRGYEERPLSMLESRRRDLITSGTMVVTKAKRIVDRLDSEVPFGCRLEFIDALAALAAVFRHDMTRKVTGANVPLHHVLKCACAPDRLEWLFNNLRWRHSLRSGLTATVCGIVICWHSLTELDTSKLNA